MDVLERLHRLMDEHGWTMYRLAKKSGLTESTIANIYRRNTMPSLVTLESICQGFGITLAQFFSDEDTADFFPAISKEYMSWQVMTQEQKTAILAVMHAFHRGEDQQG